MARRFHAIFLFGIAALVAADDVVLVQTSGRPAKMPAAKEAKKQSGKESSQPIDASEKERILREARAQIATNTQHSVSPPIGSIRPTAAAVPQHEAPAKEERLARDVHIQADKLKAAAPHPAPARLLGGATTEVASPHPVGLLGARTKEVQSAVRVEQKVLSTAEIYQRRAAVKQQRTEARQGLKKIEEEERVERHQALMLAKEEVVGKEQEERERTKHAVIEKTRKALLDREEEEKARLEAQEKKDAEMNRRHELTRTAQEAIAHQKAVQAETRREAKAAKYTAHLQTKSMDQAAHQAKKVFSNVHAPSASPATRPSREISGVFLEVEAKAKA